MSVPEAIASHVVADTETLEIMHPAGIADGARASRDECDQWVRDYLDDAHRYGIEPRSLAVYRFTARRCTTAPPTPRVW